ncbi:EscU/YscU/HrcU family type III secretion system export apparatus switch protein [Microcella daejeonensis]|uniref:EscU/YscU/HrcU family type III secretion system export apparatus switch protein n=1 Tax=Microcella daejeonensis TaxID=2994971 RepID=UPI00226E9275|nr:EscU/YscU/HrcU family type III secretion system export apparatus switch protein [Microcella daejeonensis]WAB83873.1 EscU/YscU/HrcU family type III secretion system export apparatus switch protein [Microcella daejeonensis]
MSDSQERTEKATPKKLRDATRKGRLGTSQDLASWLGIGAAGLVLPGIIEAATAEGTGQMLMIGTVVRDPDPEVALGALETALGGVLVVLAPLLVIVVITALAGSVVQGGMRLRPFTTKVEQFNLVSGVKRLFGLQAWWEGGKALMKTAVVAAVLTAVISGLLPFLASSASLPVGAVLETAVQGIASVLQAAVAVGLVLAVIDVLVVAKRNQKHTRMTRKELTDENKNTDGDPLIKAQRRARQLATSRNRMIAAVADADVVLVNPTHIAVALRYDASKGAPRVVAKGSGLIAARIREKGEQCGVPLVRDVPLARAVHAACEIGREIPAELYEAVARVLALVMAMRAAGSTPRGIIDGAVAPGRRSR